MILNDLETNRDHTVILETAHKYDIWTLLLTVMGALLLLADSCPQKSEKQLQELTVAQIMNLLLQNSDLN